MLEIILDLSVMLIKHLMSSWNSPIIFTVSTLSLQRLKIAYSIRSVYSIFISYLKIPV